MDSVEINRFQDWSKYHEKRLSKVFSNNEIAYCLKIQGKTSEKFAAYFSIKEAAYKAINLILKQPIPFLAFCKQIQISKSQNNAPHIMINWKNLNIQNCEGLTCLVTVTHTKSTSTALVVLCKNLSGGYF